MAERMHFPILPQLNIVEVKELFICNLIADGISEQFGAQLLSKTKHGDRIKICYNYLHRYGMLPNKPANTKSNILAIECIAKAEIQSVTDDKKQAMKNYSRALVYTTDSDFITLIYTARSTTLFSLKMYKECLVDIKRVLDSKCDDDVRSTVLDRKTKCEEALRGSQNSDSDDGFDFGSTHKKLFDVHGKRLVGVPCASSSVRIQLSQTSGRQIIANENISPGQVLVREKPYVSLLLKEFHFIRCYFCCSLNKNMIPCQTCTYFMFCNEECRSKSWNQGHKYECPIMPRLLVMEYSTTELFSLKVLLKLRSQYLSWTDMFKSIDAAESETLPTLKGFTRDDDGTPIYDSESYIPIHMLDTNYGNKPRDSTENRCIAATSLLHMLKAYTTFFEDYHNPQDDTLTRDKNMWRAGGLLFHLSMLLDLNMTYARSVCLKGDKVVKASFAASIYGFSSLFNHSCSPNAGYVFCGNEISIIALRPIKKGQQVFVSYGPHYLKNPLEVRREQILKMYEFTCDCEACLNDWDKTDKLKPAVFTNKKNKSKFRNIINYSMTMELFKCKKRYISGVVKDLYKGIGLLEECVPCKDHADHERLIMDCWNLLNNDSNCPLLFDEFLGD